MIQHLEEKFKNTLAHLDEKPSEQNMFNEFLALYPADWKLLKVTFSKFNRSKQFGKTIPLPRPEQQLRKQLRSWLKSQVLK
ncbi:hypothetical protein N9750_00260 [Polaribacter sp.]|nr:hypothetical protein [Polaribacter sp.]